MSKYTTELRFICEKYAGYNVSQDYKKIDEIIGASRDKIFDFEYPIFDVNYKSIIETKILKHYYTREISEETVGLWKLRLDAKMNEIMPYYNKLYNSELIEFNPLYSTNLTTNKSGTVDTNKIGNEKVNENATNNSTSNTNSIENSNSKDKANIVNTSSLEENNNDTRWDMYSDTPQGTVGNLENNSYLTNARKNTDLNNKTNKNNSVSSNDSENKLNTITSNTGNINENNKTDKNRVNVDSGNTVEKYIETIVGYNGCNPSKSIKEYRDTFLNIDLLIIKELEDLFIQLW